MSGHWGARAEALSLWQGLDAEYKRYQAGVRYIPIGEIRLQEDLRRYLCLRAAGFLEQITFVVPHEYLEQKAGGPALSFAKSWFEHAPNLNANAFSWLIGRFGDTYRVAFDNFMTTSRRESLGDLMDVRNDVAHGKHNTGQKVNPSRYIQLSNDVYEWLVETFLGASVEVLDAEGKTAVSHEKVQS